MFSGNKIKPPTIGRPGFEAYNRAVVIDPPTNPQLIEALDLYAMTWNHLNGGAWSDDTLGKVMAFAWMSSFCEACVLNQGLWVVIMVASYRFGIRGGGIPDTALMAKWMGQPIVDIALRTAPWLLSLIEERFHVAGAASRNFANSHRYEDIEQFCDMLDKALRIVNNTPVWRMSEKDIAIDDNR